LADILTMGQACEPDKSSDCMPHSMSALRMRTTAYEQRSSRGNPRGRRAPA